MSSSEARFATPPDAGTARLWWLGQGSFVFEGPRSGPLAVDPYLSNSVGKAGGPQRLFPAPVAPGELRVSAIFLTHDHTDHTDPDTVPALAAANPHAPIYGTPESVAHLERLGLECPRVRSLNRGETVTLPGATVHAVHAEHTADSVGLIFEFDDGPVIYHTADTEYFEGIGDAARYRPDLLSICINGRWGNMGIDDAVKTAQQVAAREVLPMHWGLFAENTADPEAFADRLKSAGCPAKVVLLPADGHAHHTVLRQSQRATG
jgi:Predicted Zn-dependent hydrolases of the beta-lactamase fold